MRKKNKYLSNKTCRDEKCERGNFMFKRQFTVRIKKKRKKCPVPVFSSFKTPLLSLDQGTTYVKKKETYTIKDQSCENVEIIEEKIEKVATSKVNINLCKIDQINICKKAFVFFFCHGQDICQDNFKFDPISFEKANRMFGNSIYNNYLRSNSKLSASEKETKLLLNAFSCLYFNTMNNGNLNLVNLITQYYEKPFDSNFKDPDYYGGIGPQCELIHINGKVLEKIWCPFKSINFFKKIRSIKNILQMKCYLSYDNLNLKNLPITINIQVVFNSNTSLTRKDNNGKPITLNVPNLVMTIPFVIN